MVADDPRTRSALQAVAFGRVVTPEDQTAAARALQALRELDERASAARVRAAGIPVVPVPGVGGARRNAATGAGEASGPVMVEVIDDSQAVRDGAWRGAPSRSTESLRRFWVVPVIVVSLAVGAVGGVVATRVAEKPSASLAGGAQATVPNPGSGSDSGSGSYVDPTMAVPPNEGYVGSDPIAADPPSDAKALASVDGWLSQPQQPADIFPNMQGLMAFGVDPNSSHFVTSDGTTSFWIARALDGRLCLALGGANSDMNFAVNCIERAQFPKDGVSVGSLDAASAHWDANGINYQFGNGNSGTGG